MNKSPQPSRASAGNSEAINRVLRAEQEAQAAVERCEREAQALLQAAQAQAGRIQQRTDARITWIEMRCSQWLSEQTRQLALTDKAQADAGAGATQAALAELIEALAARLTGSDDGQTP